jgi:hypothetical protein
LTAWSGPDRAETTPSAWHVALAFASALGCSSALAPRADQHVGSLSLELTLPTGADLFHVDYTIVGAAVASPRTGVIDVSVPGPTISVGVSALPVGTGYSLTLTGTATDGSTCATSAHFDIAADNTTQLRPPA